MKLFDLHCDTITECSAGCKKLFDNDLHISLKKADFIEKWIQVFAIWMPDEYRGQSAIDYFDRTYSTFQNEILENADKVVHVKNRNDFENLKRHECGAILSIEGGSALSGDISQLERYDTLGVRLMTLTWNGANEIANGCYGSDKGGLTPFGREVIKKMNGLNMLIDVSHLNEKGFYEVAALSEKPFVATHSDCFSVHEHRRNLKDEQIKLIIENNALMGLNFYNEFLGKDYTCMDGAYRHLTHLLDLGGADVVAIGADFDGCVVDEALCGIDKMQALYDYLLSRNVDEKIVKKMFYENAYLFFNKMVFTN
ncbi:hypothetical protein SDC9_121291 [bioreactor metagenome]|uniref:Membrane dipeptidase n=1 Tax=bioreactor metagenome TaxID=1076179 RepID=A0A645CBK3_9ZZZZ